MTSPGTVQPSHSGSAPENGAGVPAVNRAVRPAIRASLRFAVQSALRFKAGGSRSPDQGATIAAGEVLAGTGDRSPGSTPWRQGLALAWPRVWFPGLPGSGTGSWRERLARCLSALGLLASLLGSQSLASSSPQAAEVRLLLPAGGRWTPLSDGLRRGYGLAIEQGQVCGQPSQPLDLAWLPAGSETAQVDPGLGLLVRPRTRLLIAPPAAPLESYGVLAEQGQLTVLLPLQRGASLSRLPQLRGADHLWPLLAPRGQQADRLSQGLLAAGLRRVLVVRDGSSGQKQLAERFLETLVASGGSSASLEPGPLLLEVSQPAALEQLRQEVDWTGPQVLAVFTEPGSPLARAVRVSPWPAGLTLAWPFAELEPLAYRQVGVDPRARGAGWPAFARAFQARWGYSPGLAEAAGYDAGQLASLAAIRFEGQPGWDLQWFHGHGQPLELCAAIAARRLGQRVRPLGVASHLDGAAGSTPTAALRLSHLYAIP